MARPKKNPPADLVMPVHDNPPVFDGAVMDDDSADAEPEVHISAPPPPEPEAYPAPVVQQLYTRRNPRANIASALVAIGDLYNDAGEVSVALTEHLRSSAGEPELHSFLHRIQTLIGEFRNAVTQIESGISDKLRSAIETVQ